MDQTSDTTSTQVAPVIPGFAGLYAGLGKIAYPILRITCGALLIPHGWNKIVLGQITQTGQIMDTALGFPIPYILAWYIGLLELVGGILLVIGLLTRLVAIQVVAFMAVAAFVVHSQVGWFWNSYSVMSTDPVRVFAGGMEMPFLWMIVALVILFVGGGGFSADKAVGREF